MRIGGFAQDSVKKTSQYPMNRQAQINYVRPSYYVRYEQGAWSSFGPMPLYKAILLAVRKYRINHEPCILSEELSLVGIDSILAVRQRADFPWRAEDLESMLAARR